MLTQVCKILALGALWKDLWPMLTSRQQRLAIFWHASLGIRSHSRHLLSMCIKQWCVR